MIVSVRVTGTWHKRGDAVARRGSLMGIFELQKGVIHSPEIHFSLSIDQLLFDRRLLRWREEANVVEWLVLDAFRKQVGVG
jgi:hypothetical protein